VTKGVKQQKLVSCLYPDSRASKCFEDLARKIFTRPPENVPKDDSNFFWHHLIENNFS
jgi:MinD-like ATPase involved in chromosome partitioning or flagellar assembly